jgi:polyhydroxyalkanoate synthase
MAGHMLDLSKVTADLFILGGVTDHITPWKATYRSTQLFGSKDVTYVLSQSGHMQAILNPPGNPKAKYYVQAKKGKLPETADEWLQGTKEMKGSWWPLWMEWVQARSGKKRADPEGVGNATYKPMEKAPGLYVVEEV